MNQKKSTVKRRKYDAAFKAEVLQMVSNGRSVVEVGQALGIGDNLIYKWKRQISSDPPPLTTNSQLSIAELQSDNERLKTSLRKAEQERDILKKALHIFSRET